MWVCLSASLDLYSIFFLVGRMVRGCKFCFGTPLHFQVVRSELVQRIFDLSEFSNVYIVLMVTSGVLSAVALLTNSIPVLIGAMVIAPAFPPLGLISVAVVNRQPRLALEGAVTAGLGLALSMSAALVATWLLNATHVLPAEAELLNKALLQERVSPGWYSVVSAIAAGIAGMIALLERKMDTLVGVVAAVALVPAGVAGAIAFLSEDPIRGWGGMALLGINVALIVISGILTLLFFQSKHSKGKDLQAEETETAS